jgi:TonB family C-terminal domain
MRIYLLLFFLSGLLFQSHAQTTSDTLLQVNVKKTYVSPYERPAEFPGGDSAFYKFINTNLIYPADALEKKIKGVVFVQFFIQTDGTISDIKVVRSLYPSCDQAAIDVLSKSPKWKPGTVSNSDKTPVKTKIVRQVKFVLP